MMSVSVPQRVLHTLEHEGVSMYCTVPPFLTFNSSELSPETARLVAAFAWLPQPTATFSLLTINKIVFVTLNQCYLRERKWPFNIIWTNSWPWRVKLCYMDNKMIKNITFYVTVMTSEMKAVRVIWRLIYQDQRCCDVFWRTVNMV